MKRNSLTAIIGEAQTLTLQAYRYYGLSYELTHNMHRIRRAAVNEILRLQDSTPELGLGANTPGAAPDLMDTICGNIKPKKP